MPDQRSITMSISHGDRVVLTASATPHSGDRPVGIWIDAPREAALEQLAAHLTRHAAHGHGTVYVHCAVPADGRFRDGAVEAIKAAVHQQISEPGCDGWQGPRVRVDDAFGPAIAFAYECEDETLFTVGFWLNDTTFLFMHDLASETPIGDMRMSVAHWNPDSHTSGLWVYSYVVVADGLAVDHRREDEDGCYLHFQAVDTSTPQSLAEGFERTVSSWFLEGAEERLLQAHLLGFDAGAIDVLGGDSSGCKIEGFTLCVPDPVRAALQTRHGPPNSQEAVLWLSQIEAAVGEYWTSEMQDDVLVAALRKIANV
jgi:hypothetical protein